MTHKREFVDVAAAGDRADYAAILEQIKRDGVCPFCPENFKYHTRPILRDGVHWLATENFAPYTGTKHHFLLLHKKHVEHITEVSPEAWVELLAQVQWLCAEYKLPAGSFFIRFGDKRYTGASVTEHLHAQMLVGSPKTEETYPLSPVLGFSEVPYVPSKKK